VEFLFKNHLKRGLRGPVFLSYSKTMADKKNKVTRPPQAVDAECSLLGSVLMDEAATARVADQVGPHDFYKEKHRLIFECVLELFEKSEQVDVLTVSNRLAEKEKLDNVGGRAYLTELVNSVPTAAHAQEYARIIQKKRILRDLINASHDIAELGHNEEEDVEVLLDQAEERIFTIAQHHLTQDFVPVKGTLEEAFERIDTLSKQKGVPRGLSTGFGQLDNILAGFQSSDLVLLAGRPSTGKSALALNFASHIATTEQVPVGIFSLEMSRDQIVDRLIAAEAGIDLWRLRTGRLSSGEKSDDFQRIREALSSLSEAPIYIDDAATANVLQMRAMARRLKARRGLGLLIIDYLQLVEPRVHSDSMVRQVTEISRSLKGLARELNIPVVALSQLSRAVERRSPPRPMLADLRDSGALEQDADVVMFVFREREKDSNRYENETELIVAKHRNGPVGVARLFFDGRRVSFRDMETRFGE